MIAISRGYIKVPDSILTLNISTTAITVFIFMLSCSDNFNPSVRFMSKVLSISVNSIRKAVNELIETNVIERDESYMVGRKIMHYSFCSPTGYRKKEV